MLSGISTPTHSFPIPLNSLNLLLPAKKQEEIITNIGYISTEACNIFQQIYQLFPNNYLFIHL